MDWEVSIVQLKDDYRLLSLLFHYNLFIIDNYYTDASIIHWLERRRDSSEAEMYCSYETRIWVAKLVVLITNNFRQGKHDGCFEVDENSILYAIRIT